MLIRLAPLAALLVAALAAQPAPAQTLYKSTTPDGRIVYSDKPPADAVKSEKKELDTSRLGVTSPSAREKAALKQLQTDREVRENEEARVRRAEIALHDAEVALSLGREPQPNEHQGTASKGQRLTDGYWERQKKLEQAVEVARRNLEQARRK